MSSIAGAAAQVDANQVAFAAQGVSDTELKTIIDDPDTKGFVGKTVRGSEYLIAFYGCGGERAANMCEATMILGAVEGSSGRVNDAMISAFNQQHSMTAFVDRDGAAKLKMWVTAVAPTHRENLKFTYSLWSVAFQDLEDWVASSSSGAVAAATEDAAGDAKAVAVAAASSSAPRDLAPGVAHETDALAASLNGAQVVRASAIDAAPAGRDAPRDEDPFADTDIPAAIAEIRMNTRIR